MDYSHYSLLLLALAVALLVTEVFVPTGGILAAAVLLTMAASVFCAWQAWWETNPRLWWGYVASVLLLMPGVMIGAFIALPHTSYGRNVLLEGPKPDEINPYAKERRELDRMVGRRGRTVTPHNPGGMIVVEGRRHHSESRGMMLDAGQDVEVVAVKGHRLVVRLADAPPPAAPPAETGPPSLAETDAPRPADEPPHRDPPVVDPFDPFLSDAERPA